MRDDALIGWSLDQAAFRLHLEQVRDARLAEVDSLERLLGSKVRTSQMREIFNRLVRERGLTLKDYL